MLKKKFSRKQKFLQTFLQLSLVFQLALDKSIKYIYPSRQIFG